MQGCCWVLLWSPLASKFCSSKSSRARWPPTGLDHTTRHIPISPWCLTGLSILACRCSTPNWSMPAAVEKERTGPKALPVERRKLFGALLGPMILLMLAVAGVFLVTGPFIGFFYIIDQPDMRSILLTHLSLCLLECFLVGQVLSSSSAPSSYGDHCSFSMKLHGATNEVLFFPYRRFFMSGLRFLGILRRDFSGCGHPTGR